MQSASSANTRSLLKEAGGIIAGLLLILIANGLVIISSFASGSAEAWVEHSYRVTGLVHGVFSRLQDMETGQRGYVITGDPRYLEPYHEAVVNVDLDLGRLTRLTADNAGQEGRLTRLESLTVEKLHELEETIDLRRSRGFEAAARVVRTDRGKEIMERIRAVVAELDREESRLLAERQAASNQWWWWLVISAIVGCALGVLMIAWAIANALRTHRTTLAANEHLRASERRLSASETRYRRLFEAARDGVLMLDPQTHRIIEANPFMTELLGYAREELVGKELWEIGLLEDIAASQEAFRRLRAQGYSRYEALPLRAKTGEMREGEFVSNLYEEDGHAVIQCNIRDITERKRGEAAQQNFRALFESAPGAYLVLAPEDYEIVAASDAYLSATMTRRETIKGRRLFEVFPGDPDEPWADGVRNLRASLERVRTSRQADAMAVQRYPVPRSDSQGGGFEERWWSPVNYPVVAPDGQLVSIIHRVEDVTPFILRLRAQGRDVDDLTLPMGHMQHLEAEIVLRGQDLQRANERLRESEALLQTANRELEGFAYSVSHDLRAPLRAIDGFCRILMDDYAYTLTEEPLRCLERVSENTRKMGRLIDDLLRFSRLGRQPITRRPLAMTELARQCLDELKAEREGREVEAKVGELPRCEADRALLEQVWLNLLANALKFTRHRDPARIEAGSFERDGEVVYFVRDNGVGFDMAYADKLFGVFQRLHRQEDYEGTGVGLALVQRIIHRHGGRIWAEASPDSGAAFFFTLGGSNANA